MKMIELGIPEFVADFIYRHEPRSVGTQHYLGKARVAGQYVPRFMDTYKSSRVKLGGSKLIARG